jgi:hypothetical protein
MADTVQTSSHAIKEIIVPPLDAKRETVGVLLTIELIVLLMALRFFLISGSEVPQYIRPYQRLDTMLTGTQRTLYQTLLSSVPEIEFLRNREGKWPEEALLETEDVPPFAVAFLPKELQDYSWFGYDGETWVDYIGNNPADPRAYSFILRVIDLHADYHPHPHPGRDYDPNQKLAVQIWIYPESTRSYPGERLAEASWWWVVSPDDPSLKMPLIDRKLPPKVNNVGANQ